MVILSPMLTEHDGEQLLTVIVSHIEDPGEFYVQHSSDHRSLTTLMTQLAEHCNDNFTAIKFNSGELRLEVIYSVTAEGRARVASSSQYMFKIL